MPLLGGLMKVLLILMIMPVILLISIVCLLLVVLVLFGVLYASKGSLLSVSTNFSANGDLRGVLRQLEGKLPPFVQSFIVGILNKLEPGADEPGADEQINLKRSELEQLPFSSLFKFCEDFNVTIDGIDKSDIISRILQAHSERESSRSSEQTAAAEGSKPTSFSGTVKLFNPLTNDLRRVPASVNVTSVSYEKLVEVAHSLFTDLPSICFAWVDEDGDRITLSSDEELREAVRSMISQEKTVIRFDIAIIRL